jgi:hypothetical protein
MTTPSFSATKDADTRELLLEATNTLARKFADELRASAPDATHLDTIKRDLRAAVDVLAQRDGAAAAAQHRAICNALLLFRACPRAACRRSHACRGRAATCLAQADVPDAVFDHAVALMLARLVPAAALFTGQRAETRAAYAAWIAAMETRR